MNGEPRPDDPKQIIDGCIEARKLLLMGFGGRIGTDKSKLKEAMVPASVAISLAGEPTLYPLISEMIEEFGRRRMKSFLVTNGTRPDRLRELRKEPTNLYISLCAPDKSTYVKVNMPLIPDGWERLNESLELMKSFDCTKVLRLTLVKNLNFSNPKKYAELISKTEPDFVEVKSYSWVGDSRNRMPGTSVIPVMDLKNFAQKLAEGTSYEIKGADEASRVVLLEK
jgi:tRNA wybutosine-synthesizing protein 1